MNPDPIPPLNKINHNKWKILVSILAGAGIVAMGYFIGRIQNQKKVIVEVAPNFILNYINSDETISLSILKGNGVVLNFWAPWCLPCKEEMPLLEAASQAYKDSGVIFVGINTGDDIEKAKDFIEEFNVTYINGYDPSHKIENDYKVIGIPTTIFINAEGEITYTYLGQLDEYTMSQAISRITIP
jgi:cytochrome c biogenesis protein CcmG, thiol:disulfide interchange protein DsbE